MANASKFFAWCTYASRQRKKVRGESVRRRANGLRAAMCNISERAARRSRKWNSATRIMKAYAVIPNRGSGLHPAEVPSPEKPLDSSALSNFYYLSSSFVASDPVCSPEVFCMA